MNINSIVDKQREFFKSGKTLDYKFRIEQLKKLRNAIKTKEEKILEALKNDLGKSYYEGYMCEVGMTLSELSYMIKNLKKFMKPVRVHQTLSQFPSVCKKVPSPYGVTLVMSPWNYPFMLCMEPLIDSLAAGNTAVVKPGSYAKHTSDIINEIISEIFPDEYVACTLGGRDVNAELLEQKFDYIFFTGSKSVGQIVLEKAARHFTPVTLELGGKSPCIVDKSANIKSAAKHIVFGKFLNCGQTCVAPDYLLVEECVKDELVKELIFQIRLQFGTDPLLNSDYGKIINEKHFERLKGLIKGEKIVIGGKSDLNNRIEPTILDNIHVGSDCMKEEIFGPILPILTFKTVEHIRNVIDLNPTPLAFYLFSSDKKLINELITSISFGGGCVNDCIIHLATSKMGFGGVGESGMGAYHGKTGFDTFSHFKSLVFKSKKGLDINVRYQPYTKSKEKLVKTIMK